MGAPCPAPVLHAVDSPASPKDTSHHGVAPAPGQQLDRPSRLRVSGPEATHGTARHLTGHSMRHAAPGAVTLLGISSSCRHLRKGAAALWGPWRVFCRDLKPRRSCQQGRSCSREGLPQRAKGRRGSGAAPTPGGLQRREARQFGAMWSVGQLSELLGRPQSRALGSALSP